MKRIIFVCMLLCPAVWGARAQELNATIEINTQKIQGTNKSVFDNLKQTLMSFVNERRWTNQVYQPMERIKCSFTIIVNKYNSSTGLFECECYVQSSRPVFNASYTSSTWQIHDKKFDFTFHEFDQLNFDDEHVTDNLTALFAYYCYLIIGIDMDTMSPLGGTALLQKAMNIANSAQSLEATGWKAFDDASNRFGIINDLTNEALQPFRQLQYEYHRKGLDQMATDPEGGRAAITKSIQLLNKAYQNKSLSSLPRLFCEYKRDELVGIYKGHETSQTKQPVYDILVKINAAQNNYWKDLLK